MTDHDAELLVKDTDRFPGNRGPSGSIIVWRWTDDRPTMSPDENAVYESLLEDGRERIDAAAWDHDAVVARVWMDGGELERIEWADD